jgi:hypothetical protein
VADRRRNLPRPQHTRRRSGEITAVEETNTEVNDQKVNRVRYEFTTPQGQGAAGVCYRRAFGDPVGAAATVEYLPDRPAISRIVGCTVIPFGYFSAIVGILPIIGFGLVAGQWTLRRRALRLLRDGVFAMAKVTDVKRTNVEVNDERRFRVSVSLTSAGGELVTGYDAYGADAQMAESRLASGETVGVLYDPARPKRLYVVEKLLE